MRLATLFVFLLAHNNSVISRYAPGLNYRIVGGRPTQITEAPHQVAMLFDYWNVGTYSHYCGGAIIDRRVVLTAAHCTNGTSALQWRIRAGSSLHNSGGQVIAVNRFTQHQSFNSLLDNDISLIFLAAQLTLGPAVARINIPEQNRIFEDGTSAFVTGWGSLIDGGPGPTQLHIVTIGIINHDKCVAEYINSNPVTERMICAGQAEGGADACQGDSGAPLIIKGVLAGLASWGDGCGKPNRPGVYTRVAAHRYWIDWNI